MSSLAASVALPTSATPAGAPAAIAEAEARRWALVLGALAVVAFAATPVVGVRPALGLLVAIALLCALAGILRPVLGLYAVTILCTLDAMTRVFLIGANPILRWNTLNYLLGVVALLGIPFLVRFRTAPLRFLEALVALLVFGLLFSPDQSTGMQDVLAMSAVLGLIVYAARGSQYPGVWYWLGIVAGVTGAMAGLVYFAYAARLPKIDYNAWAQSSLTALFATVIALLQAYREHRPQALLALLAAINTACVFLSGSRGTTLAALVAVVIAMLSAPGQGRRMVLLVTMGVAAVATTAIFSEYRTAAVARASQLTDGDRSLANRTSHRWSLVVGGLYLFQRQPVTGVGTGGFIPAWRAAADDHEIAARIPDFRYVSQGRDAHAGWIKVTVENGLPGLLLLVGTLCSFIVVGRRAGRPEVGMLVALTMAVLLLSTEYRSKSPWFLAACGLCVMHGDRIAAYARAARRDRL
ncbi:MAG: O-antigen ligase family protein [Gemmatirosa sp.]